MAHLSHKVVFIEVVIQSIMAFRRLRLYVTSQRYRQGGLDQKMHCDHLDVDADDARGIGRFIQKQ